jgi:hypothetical protein
MKPYSALDDFAPRILKIYHSNKEGFWAAVMAPFLSSQFSAIKLLPHLGIDLRLLSAFNGLDQDAARVLRDFSLPLGFDVSQWDSNRPQYFKDASPVFAFLAVWMDEEGLSDLVANFGRILQAGVFAVAGYGILDENVDSDSPKPVEILTAQALIAEYETRALREFGVTPVNLEIMQKMRTLFLEAEIREKAMRWKGSPYSLEKPEGLGAKGANAVSPFMLSLERLGKTSQIDDYWRVFLLFGAAIQMIDDWKDLESDLAVGHYSYVTLGKESCLELNDPIRIARILKEDEPHIRETYERSMEMIAQSRRILKDLNEKMLRRMVDVTELRVDHFFRKEMKLSDQ